MTALPNFMLVGAAKSGTSSLYYYLKGHPEIFLANPKEPCYFSGQVLELPPRGIGDEFKTFMCNYSDYCALFAKADGHKAIGEASADTLYYHEKIIPLLHNTLGDPRIIIILRNPVDRAYSAYLHLYRDNRETCSFEDGLLREKRRIADNWLAMWHYQARGLYSRQVEAFLQSFSQVLVLLYDDLKQDPRAQVRRVCEFLGVDTAYQPAHIDTRFNASGIPRIKFINTLFLQRNAFQRSVRRTGSLLLGAEGWIAFRDRLRAALFRRPQMKAGTRASLQCAFHDDILRLQNLIHRDLSRWLQ